MSVIYDPKKILKKAAPDHQVKRMVRGNLTVNKAALTMVSQSGIVPKKQITEVALKVIKQYKETIKADVADGATKSEAKAAVSETDNALLVQRVQNLFISEVSSRISDNYSGEKARWLPSDAETPDPIHQLNYGKLYIVGEGINGEEPGQRPGCRCGSEILVDETELDLEN